MNRKLLLLLAGIMMQAGAMFAQDLAQASEADLRVTTERAGDEASTAAARIAAPEVRFYPNPVTNKLYITPAEDLNNVLFYVTDARGRVVVNQMLPSLPAGQAFGYSFDDLPAGIYIVMLQSEERLITQRIMVQ